MAFYDLTEFFRLSSALNYNLSATSLNRYNVLTFIVGGKSLDPDERRDKALKSVVMGALNYLFSAYHEKRRRLGPMAILHPLRASAILARSLDAPDIVDILAMLFHDLLEDIRPQDFDDVRWATMEGQLYDLLGRLIPADEWRLMERLQALTRFDGESYHAYIGRLLDRARDIPELVRTKLADRLDNTLDMRIDVQDPLEGIDFFQMLFQVLFVKNFSVLAPVVEHPSTTMLNGAQRLYQLFKNAVLLSMVRQRGIHTGPPAALFFHALCTASLREAQRTLLHVISDRGVDTPAARALLLEAMEYCHSGRIDLITFPVDERRLDGLFTTYFGETRGEVRGEILDRLYKDKPLMIEASVAFIVIFLSFLNDPTFFVRGISAGGIEPASCC